MQPCTDKVICQCAMTVSTLFILKTTKAGKRVESNQPAASHWNPIPDFMTVSNRRAVLYGERWVATGPVFLLWFNEGLAYRKTADQMWRLPDHLAWPSHTEAERCSHWLRCTLEGVYLTCISYLQELVCISFCVSWQHFQAHVVVDFF